MFSARAGQLDVEYLDGIHVKNSILWLDAPRQADLCFLSHAHINPTGFLKKLLLTRETHELLGTQTALDKILISPFGQKFSLGEMTLDLHPAGHMLGAAQLRIQRESKRLVYTGDFSLHEMRTAKKASILETDVLVMESNYGDPEIPQTHPGSVERDLCLWVQQTIKRHEAPILFAANPGKAQEVIAMLASLQIPIRAHRNIRRVCQQYEKLGVLLPKVAPLRKESKPNEIVILPPQLALTLPETTCRCSRRALVTGRPDFSSSNTALGLDRVFRLSGHADFQSLVEYVEKSKARLIYLVHGPIEAFAKQLRERGYNAWGLHPPQQMPLFEKNLKPDT